MVKEEKNEKKQKALVTSRVLFISVLDKIYLIILGFWFIAETIAIFNGDVADVTYGFWIRFRKEIVFLVILCIVYFLFDWLYKCAAKTMLCLTKKEVYREHYVPFKRCEDSIPLDKITKVSTINFLWIFRVLIIHQYHSFPLVFMTWNNQEFKDKLNELITGDTLKVENEYEDRNLITKDMYKVLKYIGIVFLAILGLLGIVRLFNYLSFEERKIAGTYSNSANEIVLKANGTCNIDDLKSKVEECEWSYNKEEKTISINYEYYSYYYGYSYSDTLNLKYDKQNKVLTYNDVDYKRK